MTLTRDFKDTIRLRALKDPEFRHALLRESVDNLLSGDLDTGKALLRDYVNATLGFDKLAVAMKKSPKSLMRMFGPKGNPRADNIFSVIRTLSRKEKVRLHVQTVE